jgi:hypothetical protein
MFIIGIIALIVILIFVRADYIKADNEFRRCPKCNNTVKQRFDLKNDSKQFSILGENGQKSNVTIYKCHDCGCSWNHTYEIEENVT